MAFHTHRLIDSTVKELSLQKLHQIKSELWINEQIKTESPAALMFNPFGSVLENVFSWIHMHI